MPYNSREFKDFASSWGCELTTSSPTYPQSNGLSERAVQTVKSILKKTDDPYIGLLPKYTCHRNDLLTLPTSHEPHGQDLQQGSCYSPARRPMFVNN